MNIMNLIPQKEYDRLKSRNTKLDVNNEKRAPSSKSENTMKNSTCVNQLNQTKVEDGGRQTIINTCNQNSEPDNKELDVNTVIDFPDDQTFNNINNKSQELNSPINEQPLEDDDNTQKIDTKNSLNEDINTESSDNLTGDRLPDNLDFLENIPDRISEDEEEPDKKEKEKEKDLLPYDTGQSDIRYDKIEQKTNDDNQNLNDDLQKSEENNAQSSDILPPASSSNLDDKYELWKDRNQYNYDSEIWQDDTNTDNNNDIKDDTKDLPNNNQDDDDVVTSGNKQYKNPRNPNLKLAQQKKKNNR